MENIEIKSHQALSQIFDATQDFKYTRDFGTFAKIINSVTSKMSKHNQEVFADIKASAQNLMSFYQNTKIKKNPKVYNSFYFKVLEYRAPLEAKYIGKLLSENGIKDVRQYLESKTNADLDISMQAIIDDYKNNRSEESRNKWNKVFALFNKKIVIAPKIKTPFDYRKMIRAAFEGGFKIASKQDNEAGIGCSAPYLEFVAKKDNGKRYKKEEYDFDNSYIIKLMSQSSNMAKLLPQLSDELVEQGVPPELFAKFNFSDMISVLSNKYSSPKSLEKFEKGEINNLPILYFNKINSRCKEGTKKQFQKKEEVQELIIRYAEEQKDVYLHHKFYAFDASILDGSRDANNPNDSGFRDVDSFGNIAVVVGRHTHQNIFHSCDYSHEDCVERLVDTKDGVNGQNLILSAGWRYNVYTPDNNRVRKTYLNVEIKRGEGR